VRGVLLFVTKPLPLVSQSLLVVDGADLSHGDPLQARREAHRGRGESLRSASEASSHRPCEDASPAPPPPLPPLITTTANGSNHGTKVDLQAVYQAVIFGLLTFYSPTDVFQMQAGTFTRDELIAGFQNFVTAAQATKAANQEWRADIQSERGLEVHVRELRTVVRGIVQARFGTTGAQNLQFGFTLPKPRKRSAETKAIAVKKSEATRKERNTLGEVQKQDVKGNVNVSLVVTPGGGSQPTPAGASTSPVASAGAPSGAPAVAPTPGIAPAPVVAPVAAPIAAATTAPAAPPHPGTGNQ
jgi:hypothetical protein